MHYHMHYRFTMCASKWQVEFIKQQPDEVTVTAHAMYSHSCMHIGLYTTSTIVKAVFLSLNDKTIYHYVRHALMKLSQL